MVVRLSLLSSLEIIFRIRVRSEYAYQGVQIAQINHPSAWTSAEKLEDPLYSITRLSTVRCAKLRLFARCNSTGDSERSALR